MRHPPGLSLGQLSVFLGYSQRVVKKAFRIMELENWRGCPRGRKGNLCPLERSPMGGAEEHNGFLTRERVILQPGLRRHVQVGGGGRESQVHRQLFPSAKRVAETGGWK